MTSVAKSHRWREPVVACLRICREVLDDDDQGNLVAENGGGVSSPSYLQWRQLWVALHAFWPVGTYEVEKLCIRPEWP